MAPDLLRTGFRIGVLITLLASVTFPFQPEGSAERVVTVLAGGVGLVFAAGIAIVARLSAPRLPPGDSRASKRYNGRS